jgi:hypothetical protein
MAAQRPAAEPGNGVDARAGRRGSSTSPPTIASVAELLSVLAG